MTRFALALAFLLSACVLDEEADLDLADIESEATVPTPITALSNDVPITVSLAANTITYFKIWVPSGFDHVGVYRNGWISGGPRFYLRYGRLPTPTTYDCTNATMGCGLDMPSAGTYYIAVDTRSQSYPNFTFAAGYHNSYTPISNNSSEYYYNQYGLDRLYKLAVPSDVSSVSFTYTLDPSDDGVLDLVVKRGEFATDDNYDCIKWIAGYEGLTQATCTFRSPIPGTYYIGLLGHGTKVVGTFSARYRLALVTTTTTSSL